MTFYTLPEVADQLKVSEKTLTRAIKARQLSAIRIGSKWRISQEHLDDYIDSRTLKAMKRK
jgi:excisionase family DNA binding protein